MQTSIPNKSIAVGFSQLLFLLIFFVNIKVIAQDTISASKPDTLPPKKVMIIPFNPDLYFSDSDADLAKYNKNNADDIRRKLRQGLDLDVSLKVLTKRSVKPILGDTSREARKDLKAIYDNLSYQTATPTPILLGKQEKEKKSLKLPVKSNKATETKPEDLKKSHLKIYEDGENSKYMNVTIRKPEMLTYLGNKYDTDVFLFINQFELKTKYEGCRALAINFQREMKVHFSVYDKSGKQLHGDVVTVAFPSDSNDLNKIIQDNFPLVGEYLADKMPQAQPQEIIKREEIKN